MRYWTVLLFVGWMGPHLAFSLPVTIKKNMAIRSIKNGKAVKTGNYILRSGSVIDIPDEYVIRDSIGGIDLTATLLNWRTSDGKADIYTMLNSKNRSIGEEAFFQLKVLKAAPDSILPNDEGYIALDFLARSRAIEVAEDSAPLTSKPNEVADVPIPTPRPTQYADVPVPTPRPEPSSHLIGLGGGGGGGNGSPTPPAQAGGSQTPQDDSLDIAYYEDPIKSTKAPPSSPDLDLPSGEAAPIPTPRPDVRAADLVGKATDSLPEAGTADAVCPNGKCDVAIAATDDDEKLVCEQISKGGFPKSLNSIRLTTSGQRVVDASLKWISQSLKSNRHCTGSCHFPNPTVFTWLNSAKVRLSTYCKTIQDCASRCKTSDIQTTWKCTKDSKKRGKECADSCSPYLNIDKVHRGDNYRRLLNQMTQDIEKFSPDYAKKMKANGIFKSMGQRLLCMNLRRENVDLDPMARNCASTAIGMGQVLIGTFYNGLGLINKTQQNNCMNIKLKDLASKCTGWDKHTFRKEAYWKYMDYTPKELHEMRTLDVELQARSSYATFLNKLRYASFSRDKAYRMYFGKSDKKAINRIESCVGTGR